MLNAAINWLFNLDPTIWGSLAAGSMTLIGVVIGQYAIQRREERQKENEVEALRDALAVELRTHDERLEQLLYTAHDLEKAKKNAYALTEEEYKESFESELNAQISLLRYTADKQFTSRTIYTSNTDKIGSLDAQTAEGVVRAYNQLSTLDEGLESMKRAIAYEDLSPGSEIDWSTGAGPPLGALAAKTQIEDAVTTAILIQKRHLLYWAIH
ncbi:hypothetical protein KTS45_11065 [Halomicroarcula limicola]|uniref:Uncharacterized protein n=1 Tax=Haloarcula limicola TaxID=1429915 RepID=A0A8J7YBB1_9EURY|nr:hypothetical protein [Halomicroarcula limicola]MBV0924739.1 hypothetical protein [Halomicroarcula limicola]